MPEEEKAGLILFKQPQKQPLKETGLFWYLLPLFFYAVVLHQFDDIANRCNVLQVLRGNLNVILLLKRHH